MSEDPLGASVHAPGTPERVAPAQPPDVPAPSEGGPDRPSPVGMLLGEGTAGAPGISDEDLETVGPSELDGGAQSATGASGSSLAGPLDASSAANPLATPAPGTRLYVPACPVEPPSLVIGLDESRDCWLGPNWESGIAFASGSLRRVGQTLSDPERSVEVRLIAGGPHFAELTAYAADGTRICTVRDTVADGVTITAPAGECDGAGYAELVLWTSTLASAPEPVPVASTAVGDAGPDSGAAPNDPRTCPSPGTDVRIELNAWRDCWVGPTWEEGITFASGVLLSATSDPGDPQRILGVRPVANLSGIAEGVAFDAAGVPLCRVSSEPGVRNWFFTLSPQCNGAVYAELSYR